MQNNLSDQKTKPPKENPGTLWTQQTQSEMLCLFWETRNRPEIGHWESDYQNFGGENLERFIIHGGSRRWNRRKRYIYLHFYKRIILKETLVALAFKEFSWFFGLTKWISPSLIGTWNNVILFDFLAVGNKKNSWKS